MRGILDSCSVHAASNILTGDRQQPGSMSEDPDHSVDADPKCRRGAGQLAEGSPSFQALQEKSICSSDC